MTGQHWVKTRSPRIQLMETVEHVAKLKTYVYIGRKVCLELRAITYTTDNHYVCEGVLLRGSLAGRHCRLERVTIQWPSGFKHKMLCLIECQALWHELGSIECDPQPTFTQRYVHKGLGWRFTMKPQTQGSGYSYEVIQCSSTS